MGRKKKEITPEEAPIYNEFGVCISCQGGDPGCKHNNLVQDGYKISCRLCGCVIQDRC